MNNKLYVGNLSYETTENSLQEAFASHGTVLETHLMVDRETGRARGFGFVTMNTDEEAQKAIAGLNDSSLHGRNITVNVARPKTERAGSSSSRGYGRSSY